MTNQLQGEILFGGWTGTDPSDWAYTPWMPVRSDFATFGVQVLARNGVTLTWGVQTRTAESPTVTDVVTGVNMSTITTTTARNSTACQQMFRYRFQTGAASTTDYVIFRALAPSWQVDR